MRIRREKLRSRLGDTAAGKAVRLRAEAESEAGPSILEILLRDSIIFFIM